MSASPTSNHLRPAPRGGVTLVFAALLALAAGACNDDQLASPPAAATSIAVATATRVPGADERATFRGELTLDGAPLEADFLGVRVMHDGLATACQITIPAVTQGRYEIAVAADAEARGCGASGAEVLLWVHVNDTFTFSTQTAPWPGSGNVATFDASFSSAAPEGASKPVTEIKGHSFDGTGIELPAGTVIEAFVGEVRCAVASLRPDNGDDVGRWFTLIVAGPESVSGCAQDATLTFRLDGEPAAETAINDLALGSDGHELNLTVR